MRIIIFTAALFIPGVIFAQYIGAKEQKNLENHVRYLADDKLEGRQPGTNGEKLAMEYIAGAYKTIGLLPISKENGYYQAFSFIAGVTSTSNTRCVIGKNTLKPGVDFYPLSYSASAESQAFLTDMGYGIEAPQLNHNDYANLVPTTARNFIIRLGDPESDNPHSQYAPYSDIRTKIETAIKHGATAIIFINPDTSTIENPSAMLTAKITPYEIPITFCTRPELVKAGEVMDLRVETQRDQKTAHNVVGYIDNKAGNTVVIGAHFDHLGYGDGDNSLYRGERAVHNGADDNASGTSALIEIARYLKSKGPKSNNYLFIAFSAEELGLLGSKYFTSTELFNGFKYNYMINMDMVGRLDSTEKDVLINGAGTSPAWKELFDGINIGGLKLNTSESGIGPSDHTSFYLKDIPSIHFFSGTHSDYHKPSDDADKINYGGMTDIVNVILEVIHRADKKGKLEFSKTKEPEQGRSSFKVTLGVVPDYSYNGEGLKIDGVNDGKPAAAAGIKAGDIILKIGEHNIKDIYAYMAALGKFTKGQTVEVVFKRGDAEEKTKVTF